MVSVLRMRAYYSRFKSHPVQFFFLLICFFYILFKHKFLKFTQTLFELSNAGFVWNVTQEFLQFRVLIFHYFSKILNICSYENWLWPFWPLKPYLIFKYTKLLTLLILEVEFRFSDSLFATLKIIYRWFFVKSTILTFWLLILQFYIVNFTVSLLILRFHYWFYHEINNIKW
jgi:hypothetical protein